MEIMQLTGEMRRKLRGRASKVAATVFVGANGITGNILNELEYALTEKNLVKVKLPKLGSDRKKLAAELAEAAGAELIQTSGFNAVLYRD